jgi:ribosome-associated translation inhibitor RaiA
MSTMFPEEPTPGQTGVILQNIYNTLQEVKLGMATREFVNTKFDGFSDRVERLEADLNRVALEQAKSIQELKNMVTDRINQVILDLNEENKELHLRIDDILDEKEESERSKKTRSIAVTLALIGAGLSLLVSVIQQLIISRIIP